MAPVPPLVAEVGTVTWLFGAVLIAVGTIAALWVASLRCPCETSPGVPAEGTRTPGAPPLLAMALLTPDAPELPADPVDDAVDDWAALLPGIAPAGGGR